MKIKDLFINAFVTFCGVGYVTVAPGTWASLISGILLFQFWPAVTLEWKIGLIILVFMGGWVAAEYVERRDQTSDPSMVVIDEVAGMMIASIFLPSIWWQWVLAFLVFRFFDISKIWPASVLDRRKGGFSIMADDAVASLYTILLLGIVWKIIEFSQI